VKDWLVPIVVALLTGGVGSAVRPIVQAFRGRGRARVDAVEALSETARKWVAEFEADATEARAEARQTRVELRACRQEAHALADEIRQLRLAILHPAATIDGLRELVRAGHGGGENGVNLRRP
jgi:chromosome segregation ATPase